MFFRSSTSWANMAVKASMRTYIIHQSHSGFVALKTHGEGIITTNIHKYVINVNKAINDNI